MRTGDDLDDRGDAVALDPGHDADEPVACRLGDDRPVVPGRRLSASRRETCSIVDQALAALGPLHGQPTHRPPSGGGSRR